MAKGGTLQRKYGPLPVWGWVVVGVGGYLVYRHYQASKQAGAGDAQGQPGGFSGQMGGGGKHRKRR